jgi:hypothetical protein
MLHKITLVRHNEIRQGDLPYKVLGQLFLRVGADPYRNIFPFSIRLEVQPVLP